ncbi:MAG: ComEC/Rec2 family competence protein [Chloroflexi bacterium]|nr:MAG: ComEC/Rec2 family competence protein [Chloroflexota bacterium]
MRTFLETPLAPGALLVTFVAFVARGSPLAAASIAALFGTAALVLAISSADRPRRLCWAATALTCALAAVTLVVGPFPGFDLRHAGPLDGVRESLSLPLRRLIGEPEGGIVRGIVLGERASVDADLASAFARSGTSHLLAISGFNMTLVATGVGILARGRIRPSIAAAATAGAVVAYSVLVGLAPSVLRAALMASVAAAGVAFGRRAATVNALALAIALMLAVDASAIGDVGFLLSAGATAGLLFLGEPLSARLGLVPKAIREGLATTIAATVPTLPIIAAVFGRISLVSPLANLAAVPLFAPLMLAGAATAVVGTLSTDLARVPALITSCSRSPSASSSRPRPRSRSHRLPCRTVRSPASRTPRASPWRSDSGRSSPVRFRAESGDGCRAFGGRGCRRRPRCLAGRSGSRSGSPSSSARRRPWSSCRARSCGSGRSTSVRAMRSWSRSPEGRSSLTAVPTQVDSSQSSGRAFRRGPAVSTSSR